MKNGESLLLGMALGAGLAYLLDAERGSRRRALVRDQVVHAGHELEDAARRGLRHTRNRAAGLAHEVRAELLEGEVDDVVLEERVRSEIGRSVQHPGRVDVMAADGTVTLRGEVASNEVQPLVRAAKRVRGVERVDNELDVRGRADAGEAAPAEREADMR